MKEIPISSKGKFFLKDAFQKSVRTINRKIESEPRNFALFGRQDIESRFLYLRVVERTRLEGCLATQAGCDYRLDDLTLARLHC